MTTSKKLIYGILAAVAIVAFGSFIYDKFDTLRQRIVSISAPDITQISEAVIATDKTEYGQGETVGITVKNNLDKSI